MPLERARDAGSDRARFDGPSPAFALGASLALPLGGTAGFWSAKYQGVPEAGAAAASALLRSTGAAETCVCRRTNQAQRSQRKLSTTAEGCPVAPYLPVVHHGACNARQQHAPHPIIVRRVSVAQRCERHGQSARRSSVVGHAPTHFAGRRSCRRAEHVRDTWAVRHRRGACSGRATRCAAGQRAHLCRNRDIFCQACGIFKVLLLQPQDEVLVHARLLQWGCVSAALTRQGAVATRTSVHGSTPSTNSTSR